MLGGSLLSGANATTGGLSKDFFDLVKGIGESRSKQEEDRIMMQEVLTLKSKISDANVTKSKMREYLARALYAEMLGHDASFAQFHAVKLASDKNILCKRTGYMFCGLSLRPQHELLLLLINTIQKDLASSDFLEVAAALNCCAQIVHLEAIPILLPSITNLTIHSKELVRRKALSALVAMYNRKPSILPEIRSCAQRTIHDSDPGVISASLNLIEAICRRAKEDQEAADFYRNFEGLVPSLVYILKDILNHNFPRDWDFHRVPAPWLQMKILNLLGVLVGNDQRLSEEVYEILRTIISKGEQQVNVSCAILFECIKTIAVVYPLGSLCELAGSSVSRFIESDNKNLRHAGISGLLHLVQIDAAYVAKHQLSIIDCLDDKDETLRSKALDLLVKTTNSTNVVAVVNKLLESADFYIESDSKKQLIQRAIDLTDRFCPDHHWYLSTMTRMLLEFSIYVPIKTAHEIITLIDDGPTANPDQDNQFRELAVGKMLTVLAKMHSVSESALLVSAWTVGTHGHRSKPPDISSEDILDLLLEATSLEKTFTSRETHSYLVTALIKHTSSMIQDLIHHNPQSLQILKQTPQDAPAWWTEVLRVFAPILTLDTHGSKREWDFDLAQQILEFLILFNSPTGIQDILVVGCELEKGELLKVANREEVEHLVASRKIKSSLSKGLSEPKRVQRGSMKRVIGGVKAILPPSQVEKKVSAPLKFEPYFDKLTASDENERGRSDSRHDFGVASPSIAEPTDCQESTVVKSPSGTEDFHFVGSDRWRTGLSGPYPRSRESVTSTFRQILTPSRSVPSSSECLSQTAAPLDPKLDEKRRAASALFAGVLASEVTSSSRSPSPKPLPRHRRATTESSSVDLLNLDDDTGPLKTEEDEEEHQPKREKGDRPFGGPAVSKGGPFGGPAVSKGGPFGGPAVSKEEKASKSGSDRVMNSQSVESVFSDGADSEGRDGVREFDGLLMSNVSGTEGLSSEERLRGGDSRKEKKSPAGGLDLLEEELSVSFGEEEAPKRNWMISSCEATTVSTLPDAPLEWLPYPVTTEQIAATWESLENERKLTIGYGRDWQVEDILGYLKEDPYRFHTIQIIGNEGLSAVLSSDGVWKMYLYCKAERKVELTLRTNMSLEKAEAYLQQMKKDLSELLSVE